jgi:hypothetical protein
MSLLNASSLRKRLTLTHECCINESVSQSQSYVGKSVVSLLSIPTIGTGYGWKRLDFDIFLEDRQSGLPPLQRFLHCSVEDLQP